MRAQTLGSKKEKQVKSLINSKITKVKKVGFGGVEKPSKTNLSKIWGKIQGEETRRNGRPEESRKGDKANGKTKENVSTYHDALMRKNPFHPPPAKKHYMHI